MPGAKGSRDLLRDLNMSLVIELVRQRGPISRADLSRETELSPSAVTMIVGELIERGIVSEVAVAPSRGGRPPILLRLNPSAGFVVGVKLRGDGLTTVVCDLDAEIVATDEAEALIEGDPDAALGAIEEATRRVLRAARVSRSKVLGVGIGLSGVIDAQSGICRYSHLLRWTDVALAEPLTRRLKLPVWAENDVKTLAIAEKWSGDAINAHDFVTLSLGRGIGLGIVIGRTIYRGSAGGAGEFGHTTIDPEGPQCECGRRGCLEAFVGQNALQRRLSERLSRDLTAQEFFKLVAESDLTALGLLADAGRQLGVAVANVVTLLNPELLIISGEGTRLGAAFIAPVVSAVHEMTFADLGKELEVKVQQWGDDAWAVGAATLVLRESFRIPGAGQSGQAIWRRMDA